MGVGDRFRADTILALGGLIEPSVGALFSHPVQLQPSHSLPEAKHSQYFFKQFDFLHAHGLRFLADAVSARIARGDRAILSR